MVASEFIGEDEGQLPENIRKVAEFTTFSRNHDANDEQEEGIEIIVECEAPDATIDVRQALCSENGEE